MLGCDIRIASSAVRGQLCEGPEPEPISLLNNEPTVVIEICEVAIRAHIISLKLANLVAERLFPARQAKASRNIAPIGEIQEADDSALCRITAMDLDAMHSRQQGAIRPESEDRTWHYHD